jgi:hypothetical protein
MLLEVHMMSNAQSGPGRRVKMGWDWLLRVPTVPYSPLTQTTKERLVGAEKHGLRISRATYL